MGDIMMLITDTQHSKLRYVQIMHGPAETAVNDEKGLCLPSFIDS